MKVVLAVLLLGALALASAPAVLPFSLAELGSLPIAALKAWEDRGGFSRNLSYGSTGRDVRLLQQALSTNPALYPSRLVTGYFGPLTYRGVTRFQEEAGLPGTGFVGPLTRAALNEEFLGQFCPQNPEAKPRTLARITKSEGLPLGYIPPRLVEIGGEVPTIGIVCLREDAASHLEEMVEETREEGLFIGATSGFRHPGIQQFLYDFWLSVQGLSALDFIAVPGHSEHQLGTTVDLTGSSVGWRGVSPYFGRTPEGRWVAENAHRFGFVMSYPKGKRSVTGYNHEPWHFRYVGKETAEAVTEQGVTLTEYLR